MPPEEFRRKSRDSAYMFLTLQIHDDYRLSVSLKREEEWIIALRSAKSIAGLLTSSLLSYPEYNMLFIACFIDCFQWETHLFNLMSESSADWSVGTDKQWNGCFEKWWDCNSQAHVSSLFLTLKLYLENVVMGDGTLRLGADAGLTEVWGAWLGCPRDMPIFFLW